MSHQNHRLGLATWEWWPGAIENLEDLSREHGREAAMRAQHFAAVYLGKRGSMVLDVIASRQRRYESRVRSMVSRYEEHELAPTLASLAIRGPVGVSGLRNGEASTLKAVAAGLLRFAEENDLDEDAGVALWAKSVEAFVHAPKLEPYVGKTPGVGPALFAYLRMRSGAGAIKPDIRVHSSLVQLGFDIPLEEHSILLVTQAAAEELGVRLLVLDQLLWWAGGPSDTRAGG